ncbi:hypothetical protein DVH24_006665 [Malus domestica]|uniref:Disease resistance N-terminal domain-containing protein n=1 Tax=Malus domestica TaxID=3750 RepID=A0A498KCY8_MALDO|nr:hypothetical protein DVH24_006665 [Malus domestica]
MALEVVGGAVMSAFLQAVFEKMASPEVREFIRGKKLTQGLLNKLEIMLLSVNVVLDDAEEKQISNSAVKHWLEKLKESVYDADDLLDEIKTEALSRKLEVEAAGSSTSQVQERISSSHGAFDKSVLPKIHEVVDRLNIISQQKDVLNLKAHSSNKTSHTLPSTSLEWHEWSYNEEGKEAFPKLCQLRLLECPKLTRILPLDYFPKLETLEMRSANVEFLTISQESELLSISKLDIYFCPNFVCFSNGVLHAPHLTKISIWGCKKLRSLPEQMHTLLPSLRNLWIVDCPELESFPEGGLPSELSSLYIRSCKKLIANRMQWGLGRLTSLVDLALSFEECEEVGAFPEEGLLPPPLTTLSIIDMSNLKTMDGRGLRQLICLERLTIWRCPELQCLPVEGLPASLSHLSIRSCPLLKLRCQRQTGEDWTKIAHIPNIEIEWEEI